jgi:membrane protease YdiL (CAAX protease family)
MDLKGFLPPLAFFALIMGIVSFWVKRSPWVWGGFFLLFVALGLLSKLLDPVALLPILALFALHGLLSQMPPGFFRFFVVLATISISIGLWVHLFPGFHSLPLSEPTALSPGAQPYGLFLHPDKPLIGFFVLAWGLPLIGSLSSFRYMLKFVLPLSIAGALLLALIALYTGMIAWAPKLPTLFWLFIPLNLLLVAIPEEAFMRGFVQNECLRLFGDKGIASQILAILLTSLLFAALHYGWSKNIPFLFLVFIAGVIYGSIYQFTRAIEASIICHYIFNLIHFSLFTYPVLVVK